VLSRNNSQHSLPKTDVLQNKDININLNHDKNTPLKDNQNVRNVNNSNSKDKDVINSSRYKQNPYPLSKDSSKSNLLFKNDKENVSSNNSQSNDNKRANYKH